MDTSVHARSDSDHTTVISPRIRFRQGFEHRGGETSVNLLDAAVVWTSASVDIRTAASPRVTEQRDEIVASIDHREDSWELGLGYRFSTEPDFLANGLSFSFTWEVWPATPGSSPGSRSSMTKSVGPAIHTSRGECRR